MKSAAIMLVIAAVMIFVGMVSKNWISGGRGSRDIHIGPLGIEACFDGACVSVPNKGMPGDIEAIMMLAVVSGFAAAAAAGIFGGMALAKKTHAPVPPKLAHMAFGLAAFSMTFFLIRMISEKGELSWAGFPAIIGVILAGVGLKKLTPFLTAKPALPPGQSQGMQPHGQQQPYGQQSQPMQPYAGQQSQPMQPYANQSGMQPQGQYGSQPYGQQSQPMQPQQQYGSQPHAQTPHAPPPQQAAVPNCPRCGTQLHFVAQYQRWFCPREQQYV